MDLTGPDLIDQAAHAVQKALVWSADHRWIAAAIAVTAVFGMIAVVAEVVAWLRRNELLRALDDSTRGRLIVEHRRGWYGARARINPVPEPFASLTIECDTSGPGGRQGLLRGLLGIRRQRLALYGSLARRPAAELIWERGRTPDRALGTNPESGLWMAHRLEYLSGAYAVHGTNTAALEHAFVDLQARFGPYLQRAVLQANTSPQFVIVLVVNGMNREDVPALISTVRSLTRAALIE